MEAGVLEEVLCTSPPSATLLVQYAPYLNTVPKRWSVNKYVVLSCARRSMGQSTFGQLHACLRATTSPSRPESSSRSAT